jgi:large subunit ribosomal protein L3
MTIGLIGKKIGMSQVFDKDGILIPVTLIEAGPCPILQKKEKGKNGYSALQLGFDKKPERTLTKPEAGLFKKVNSTPIRIIREFRVEDISDFEIGQMLEVDIFEEGERVDVTGITKGRGFTGVVKRHHTSRGPETHGSKYHRRVGSMSASSDPSRVFKGKPMPGQFGNQRRTISNLKVVGLQKEKNLLLIKGSVPGSNNGYVMIRKKVNKTVKK